MKTNNKNLKILIAVIALIVVSFTAASAYIADRYFGLLGYEAGREIIYTNRIPYDGNSCQHKELNENGEMTGRFVYDKSISSLQEKVESNYLKIDADIEIKVRACSAVVPNAESKNEEVIVIKKVYSVEPANFDDIAF